MMCPNLAPRSSMAPVTTELRGGFQNPRGLNCYLASPLQVLLNTSAVREVIETHAEANHDTHTRVWCLLKKTEAATRCPDSSTTLVPAWQWWIEARLGSALQQHCAVLRLDLGTARPRVHHRLSATTRAFRTRRAFAGRMLLADQISEKFKQDFQPEARESKATPVGFEPTRGDPVGSAGRRPSRLAKVSLAYIHHWGFPWQAKQFSA